MRPRRAAILALILAALLPAVAARASTGRVAIFTMYDQPLVKPATLYLTADAGPYLTALKWSGWGSARAVATGRLISDCASCVKENTTVTVTLTRLAGCPKHHDSIYTHGVYLTSRRGARPHSLDLGDSRKIFC